MENLQHSYSYLLVPFPLLFFPQSRSTLVEYFPTGRSSSLLVPFLFFFLFLVVMAQSVDDDTQSTNILADDQVWEQLGQLNHKKKRPRKQQQPTLDLAPTTEQSIPTTPVVSRKPKSSRTSLFHASTNHPRKPTLETCESNPSAVPLTNHTSVLEEEDSSSRSKKRGIFGPKKAPSAIRPSVRFDYQPDICKDYKETGYCGFGDACKFLHDRSDYKSGWQLEQEWEQQQQKPKDKPTKDGTSPAIPFACHICRKPFVSPIVTLCGHYFCEACALDYHRSHGGKCAVCSKPTKGVFNTPRLLL